MAIAESRGSCRMRDLKENYKLSPRLRLLLGVANQFPGIPPLGACRRE
jgi:hypothetical protein